MPIELPEGVSVLVQKDFLVAKGAKGELTVKIDKSLNIDISDNLLAISRKNDQKFSKSIHGTTRALVANAVTGVSRGWDRKLEMVGTGYRAEVKGNDLVMSIGFSHPVEIKAPEGINFLVEKNVITVSGIDKELVGQVAANIRKVRPPEPYKGKGIRYIDEYVRRKPGKAAKSAE